MTEIGDETNSSNIVFHIEISLLLNVFVLKCYEF